MPDNIQDLSLKLIQSAAVYRSDLSTHRKLSDRLSEYRKPRAQFNRWRNSEPGKTWKQQQLQAINCTCPGCNRQKYPEDFVIDHIIPISKGGHPINPTNLQLLCYPCNASKGKST